jgi:PAS domain S-box-containing protein
MLNYLLDRTGFTPRWDAGEGWAREPWLGWTLIAADIGIWAAYTAIPVILLITLQRTARVTERRILWLFGAFILACGTVHLIDALLFWYPLFRLSAVAKLITAAVSWMTVFVLIPVLPKVLSYRSPEELERNVAERTKELEETASRLTLEARLRAKAARSLRISEERLRLALLAGRMGTWDWNLETNDVVFDDAEKEIIGLESERSLFPIDVFFKLVHPDDTAELQRAIRSAISGTRPYDHTFRITTPAGRLKWIAGRGIVVTEPGEPKRFVGVNYDVTNLKEAEIELAEARKKADSANDAKSRFLANTSHEIRTPLTAILGCAESLVRENVSGPAGETARMVKNQGELLMRILNDVLDLSKIEAGHLEVHMQPCSPAVILNDIKSTMEPIASAKGLELNVSLASPIPRTMKTDAVRIRQMLLNLTSNGIKFTERGTVSIVAEVVYVDDDPFLQIEVRDTGIGIPADQLRSVFEPFHQVNDDSAVKYHGTGLGLTISSRLARMLGGQLTVESQLGKGSTFRLQLPVNDSSLTLSSKDSIRPEELFVVKLAAPRPEFTPDVRGRVLIAEDTRSVQFLLKRIFAPFAGELTFVEDGQTVIERVTKARSEGKPYDLVLMDMQMPVLTGYEATKRLRQMNIDTPVIALTASAMAGDRERCLAAGCNAYLAKPIDWDAMVAEVLRWLTPPPSSLDGNKSP